MMDANIPAGLSKEEQEELLKTENELAAARDKEQREFLNEQEKMREARETSQRLLIAQEEKAREASIKEQEQQAADIAVELEDAPDADTSVANMYSALAFGTDVINDSEPNMRRPQ